MSRKVMTDTEDHAFAALWAHGATYAELQAIFGLANPSSVNSVRTRLDLPARASHAKPRTAGPAKPRTAGPEVDTPPKTATVPALPPHPFWTPERDLAVMVTQGRYREVGALARRLGRAQAAILQRWHQLRAA